MRRHISSEKTWVIAVILLAIAAVVVLVYPASEFPPSDYVFGPPAFVGEIDIRILDSFPVKVSVTAKGWLPNPCTRIGRIDVAETIHGDFEITINTMTAPDDGACAQAIVPFEETIPLNVTGHYAGIYQVTFNNPDATTTEAGFELQQDNFVRAHESCTSHADCILPMEYAIQSNCPFGTACISNECRVVCPLAYHDPDPGISISYPYTCDTAEDCDCSWRGGRTLECACIDGTCASVEF